MNKIKQVFLPISILVLFLSCFAVVQAEEVNPFSLEIIRIHGDEEQVQVYVKVDAAYGLSSFDFYSYMIRVKMDMPLPMYIRQITQAVCCPAIRKQTDRFGLPELRQVRSLIQEKWHMSAFAC